MSEGWYLTELGERAATITRLEAELVRWKNRVRELEDAIIIHQREVGYHKQRPTDDDYALWEDVEDRWT